MTLIRCVECGREISNLAEACPGCGAPVSLATSESDSPIATEPHVTSSRPERPTRTASPPKQDVLARVLGIAGIVLGFASLAMPYSVAIVVVVVAVVCGVVAILRRHKMLGAAALVAAGVGLVALIYVAQPAPSTAGGTSSSGDDGSAVVTLLEYEQIADGMIYSEVATLIGADGLESEGSEVDGFPTTMFTWTNPDGSNVNVMLHNGQVIEKTQVGLD